MTADRIHNICANCAFWAPHDTDLFQDGQRWGQCRVVAPFPQGVFPQTDERQWCGQFKSRYTQVQYQQEPAPGPVFQEEMADASDLVIGEVGGTFRSTLRHEDHPIVPPSEIPPKFVFTAGYLNPDGSDDLFAGPEADLHRLMERISRMENVWEPDLHISYEEMPPTSRSVGLFQSPGPRPEEGTENRRLLLVAHKPGIWSPPCPGCWGRGCIKCGGAGVREN